jgi:hypothetical protein
MKKTILLISALVMMQQLSFGQCYPDRHSTNFFDGWVSCEAAPNPNPARPMSHFIMYDFGKVYTLGQMKIWNTNDPAHLDWGMRDVAIDYSSDGENWVTAGEYTFPQASGLSTYEGSAGPHLNDIEARYLVITGINNYGGTCYGLSEMHVDAEEVIISSVADITELPCLNFSIYPNPFADQMTMVLEPGCSGDLRISIYDGSGKMLTSQTTNLVNGQQKAIEMGRELPAGAYRLYLEYGGKMVQRSIVKMNRT